MGALRRSGLEPRRRVAARAGAAVPVAISMGDPCGIGPEVAAAALARPDVLRRVVPVLFGDGGAFARACRLAHVPDRLPRVASGEALPLGPCLVEVSALPAAALRPGRPNARAGEAQGRYVEEAIAAVKRGGAAALCTAPVSKAALHRAGWRFPGHTELLAERFGVPRVVMMLAGPSLKVALATTHLPLKDVSGALSAASLVETLGIVHRELVRRFGIRRPRIAVCGLNPHAGEGGLFGDEERTVIAPAIAAARRRGISATGPWPADGLFPRAVRGEHDAVLAMYHDQGLVALKLLHFEDGVNVTLGLPVVRTSPDHGVAYDLAGTGRASASSMAQALLLAARLSGRGRP